MIFCWEEKMARKHVGVLSMDKSSTSSKLYFAISELMMGLKLDGFRISNVVPKVAVLVRFKGYGGIKRGSLM